VAGIGQDALPELFPLVRRAVRSDQHTVATRFADGLYHQFVEILKNVVSLRRIVEQIGFKVVEDWVLFQVVRHNLRHVSIQSLIVGNPGTKSIGKRNIPGPVSIEQSSHAEDRLRSERQRIDEVVVDTAVDDIYPAEARGRAHVDNIVMRDQIPSLDKFDPHLAGQICVLEVRRVENPWTQQDDRGLGPPVGRQRAQSIQERLGVMLDRAYSIPLKQLRKDSLHDTAVGQHVRHTARHSQVVFEDHKLAAGQADQIGSDNGDIHITWHLQSAHLPPKVFAAVHDLPRYHAVGEDSPLVVNIPEEQVECSDPLGQTTFDVRPFRAGDDARQKVVWKDSL